MYWLSEKGLLRDSWYSGGIKRFFLGQSKGPPNDSNTDRTVRVLNTGLKGDRLCQVTFDTEMTDGFDSSLSWRCTGKVSHEFSVQSMGEEEAAMFQIWA
jgi:hypothetical protein